MICKIAFALSLLLVAWVLWSCLVMASKYDDMAKNIGMRRKTMSDQLSFQIENSNITKLGFVNCEDCEEQVICPHSGIRIGCRTVEKLKEVHWDE